MATLAGTIFDIIGAAARLTGWRGVALSWLASTWTHVFAAAPLITGAALPLLSALLSAVLWWRRQPWFWAAAVTVITLFVVSGIVVPITAEYLRIESGNGLRRAEAWRCSGESSRVDDFIWACERNARFLSEPLATAVYNVLAGHQKNAAAWFSSWMWTAVATAAVILVSTVGVACVVGRRERDRLRRRAVDTDDSSGGGAAVATKTP